MKRLKSIEVIEKGRLKGLTILHNFIDLNIIKKDIDLDQPRDYGVYITRFYAKYITPSYIGKAVFYENKDGSTCYRSRPLSHRYDPYDSLMEYVRPENCEIYTLENLTETEAKAVEAWLISLIEGTTMSKGQKRWRGEQFLNKRCEDINRELINYYNLDGINDVESFRKEINNY